MPRVIILEKKFSFILVSIGIEFPVKQPLLTLSSGSYKLFSKLTYLSWVFENWIHSERTHQLSVQSSLDTTRTLEEDTVMMYSTPLLTNLSDYIIEEIPKFKKECEEENE